MIDIQYCIILYRNFHGFNFHVFHESCKNKSSAKFITMQPDITIHVAACHHAFDVYIQYMYDTVTVLYTT